MKQTVAQEGKANPQNKSDVPAARSGGSGGPGPLSSVAGAERLIPQLHRTLGNRAMQRLLQADTEGRGVGLDPAQTDRPAHASERLPPTRPFTPAGVEPKPAPEAPVERHTREANPLTGQVAPTPVPRLALARAGDASCHRCESHSPEARPAGAAQLSVPTRAAGDVGAAPAEVGAGALRGPGAPIEPGAAGMLAQRFGFDVGAVRIHTDPSAAGGALALGARAYTWLNHVVFAPGAYQPHTASGRALLAHELTHVAQQLGGSNESEEAQERQAYAVEAGASFAPPRSGAPRPALRLRAGDAVSLTISVGTGGAASFSAEVDGGATVTASGTVTELQPGEYQVQMTGTQMIIRRPDDTVVPSTSRFDIPWSQANAALLRALGGATSRIPMRVVSGPAPAAGGGGEPPAPGSDEARRRELSALPERVRNFLFAPGGSPTRPEDYAALLRIAHSISDLSEEELAAFRARTTGSTSDVADFEASVNRWLTQLRAQRTADRDLDKSTQALYGLDQVYTMYQSWQTGLLMGSPPSWIAEWEALPVSALPAEREGTMNQLYLDMRRSLAQYKYANLAAFTSAIQQFIDAFRESAYHLGIELLDRYQHVLTQERDRYQATTGTLFDNVAPARTTFRQADEYRDAAQSQYGGSWDPGDVMAYHAAGGEYQDRIARGRGQVASQAGTQPLLGNRDFPLEELGRAPDQSAAATIIGSYITTGLERVKSTRERLRDDHEVIFRLDLLVSQTKARQGIQPNTVWSRVIEDHQAPTVDQVMVDVMLGVLAVGLGIMSGGSLLAAGASLGLSSYFAIQQYQDYAFRSDAYGAQLLSDEPSLAWVILAIVGVVADFAVVSQVMRPIRPALKEFQRTGDVAALEVELAGVEERIRRSIISRAHIEARAQRGWQGLAPGAARASIGIDLIVEGAGHVAYAVYINLRRGINTFNRWVRTREALDLIGEINNLTPAQQLRLQSIYQRGLADAERIAAHGRSLNMTDEAVDEAIQNWARRGNGTVDDAMREMTASRNPAAAAPEAAPPAGAAPEAPWMPPKSWNGPVNHGRWTGARGNSGWIDDRPEVIRVVGRTATGEANPVPFRSGVVDFSKWSQGELTVAGLTGEHANDMNLIRLAVADMKNLLPGGSRSARINAALEWLRNAPDGHGGTGLRPHHAGGSRIQLVPKDVHKVQHTDLSVY